MQLRYWSTTFSEAWDNVLDTVCTNADSDDTFLSENASSGDTSSDILDKRTLLK